MISGSVDVAVAVEGPVTTSATATFTGDACTWEGPASLDVDSRTQAVLAAQRAGLTAAD